MTRTLGETAERMLDSLPPYYFESTDVRGVLDTLGDELDSVDAQVAALIGDGEDGELFPTQSTNLLSEWERTLGLAVNPTRTVAQRRNVIAALLLSLKTNDSADVWRRTFNTLVGGGWSWAMDYGTYTLTLYLPYGPEMTSPTNFALSSGGSGNALATGTYYYSVTSVNAYGESAYEGGDSIAITEGEAVTVTWDEPLIGTPEGYNIYRGESADAMFRLNNDPISALSYTDAEVTNLPLLMQKEASAAKGRLAPTESSTKSDFAVTIIDVARAITPAHINVAVGYTEGFILDVSKVGDLL